MTAIINDITNHGSSAPPTKKAPPSRWTPTEDAQLRAAVERCGTGDWRVVAAHVPLRSNTQCLQRWMRSLKPGLRKGKWTYGEDDLLRRLCVQARAAPRRVRKAEDIDWPRLARGVTGRTSKQCRERWFEHLSPAVNRGPYSAADDALLLALFAQLGNAWTAIAAKMEGRTPDGVKVRIRSLQTQARRRSQAREAESRLFEQQHQEHPQQQAVGITNTLKRQRSFGSGSGSGTSTTTGSSTSAYAGLERWLESGGPRKQQKALSIETLLGDLQDLEMHLGGGDFGADGADGVTGVTGSGTCAFLEDIEMLLEDAERAGHDSPSSSSTDGSSDDGSLALVGAAAAAVQPVLEPSSPFTTTPAATTTSTIARRPSKRAQRATKLQVRGWAHFVVGVNRFFAFAFAAAAENVEKAKAIATRPEVSDRHLEAWCDFKLSMIAFNSADFGAALDRARSCMRLALGLGHGGLRKWAHIVLGFARLGAGAFAHALVEARACLGLEAAHCTDGVGDGSKSGGSGGSGGAAASAPDAKVRTWAHHILSCAHNGRGEFEDGLEHARHCLRWCTAGAGASASATNATPNDNADGGGADISASAAAAVAAVAGADVASQRAAGWTHYCMLHARLGLAAAAAHSHSPSPSPSDSDSPSRSARAAHLARGRQARDAALAVGRASGDVFLVKAIEAFTAGLARDPATGRWAASGGAEMYVHHAQAEREAEREAAAAAAAAEKVSVLTQATPASAVQHTAGAAAAAAAAAVAVGSEPEREVSYPMHGLALACTDLHSRSRSRSPMEAAASGANSARAVICDTMSTGPSLRDVRPVVESSDSDSDSDSGSGDDDLDLDSDLDLGGSSAGAKEEDQTVVGALAVMTATLRVDTTGDGRDDTTMTVPQAIEHQAQSIITRCAGDSGEDGAGGRCMNQRGKTANQHNLAALARALERMGCEERAQEAQGMSVDADMLDDIDILLSDVLW